ncbi:MAG: helix-turn-helix domain-containing protein [Candidatus Paceibacterota bacterium]
MIKVKNDIKLLENLHEFGLQENEAKVYLASLSLGPTTILNLSKYGEVKRTTVYEVVDSLEKKGLMKKEVHGFKTLYSPEHPERLENTLESKRVLLFRVLPELEGKYHLKGTESSIKYYEGLSAIKNIYDDLLKDLKPHDFYYAISNIREWQGLDEDFFIKNHVEKRAKMSINTKLIFTDSPTAQNRKKTERNFNEEIKIIPDSTNIHLDFVITPYKLVMFQLHNPLIALVIENQSMINAQKEIFDLLWSKSS